MLELTISFMALLYGVEQSFAFRVAKIESGLNPKARSVTDSGLYQLNRRFHRFHNLNWAFDPVINMNKALYTIREFKKRCEHLGKPGYLLCYNMGVSGAKRLKHPHKQTYYKKLTTPWQL